MTPCFRSNRPFLGNWLVTSILPLMLLGIGCAPEGEIRQYVVDAESDRIVTSDLLKSEFGTIPFEWDTPESWTVADNDQFSKVAWEVGSKPDVGRITVSDVDMGMGLMSQLTRWRGQVGIELPESADPMTGTEQLKLDGTTATYIDFQGTEQSILGMMFAWNEKLWVFKFRGSNAVTNLEKERFREFCESVKVPQN